MSKAPLLTFGNGFDWSLVAWGNPDSPARELCGYCHGSLPEVPLRLFRPDGAAAAFCDVCTERYLVSAMWVAG
jgi:hypothetical protein